MYQYDLLNKFVNFDDESLTGQVVGVSLTDASALMNWQAMDSWFGAKTKNRGECPKPALRIMLYADMLHLTADTPKYLLKDLAFLTGQGKIQSVHKFQPRQAKPSVVSSTSVRDRTDTFKELEMAKTFVFDSENEIIGEFDSVKEAKTHHKGQPDVTFVHAKNFPEGGIGTFATVEDLFPAPEVVEQEEGEKPARTRTMINRAGPYTVVKADGTRFPEGDERGALHEALISSSTVEEFLEKAPAEAKYVSTKGVDSMVTASAWFGYAIKRGWITQDVEIVSE